MSKQKVKQNRRRGGYNFLKGLIKIFIRKPKYVYVGEKIKDGSIILSNHVGKTAPLKLDLFLPARFRFWGAHEMNEGFRSLYKYLSEVFYHEKKHWNLGLARLFCVIAAPLTYVFYRGLNLISTYRDHRLKNTIKESIETLKNNESIVIFPEDSSEGYHDELRGFHAGFTVLAKACLKRGMDLPIYVTYFDKQTNQHIIGAPVLFSELVKDGFDRAKISKQLCDRTNDLRNYIHKK